MKLSLEYHYHRFKQPAEGEFDYFGKIGDAITEYQTGYYMLDTTLIDTYGYKVYEGDILRMGSGHDMCIVLWSRFHIGYRCFSYCSDAPNPDCFLIHYGHFSHAGYVFEKLGNIFTHPHLLDATTQELIDAIRTKLNNQTT